jgi:hypothetical protein
MLISSPGDDVVTGLRIADTTRCTIFNRIVCFGRNATFSNDPLNIIYISSTAALI